MVLLTLGMFFVWSIIGLQLWGGLLESRCYYPPTRQYDIPLVRCSSSSMPMVGMGTNCNGEIPSNWVCTPVRSTDVFTVGSTDNTSNLYSSTTYTEIKSSQTFLLNRTNGRAIVIGSDQHKDECRIECPGCRSEKVWYREPGTTVDTPVEIMLNLDQSKWITTGELIFARGKKNREK